MPCGVGIVIVAVVCVDKVPGWASSRVADGRAASASSSWLDAVTGPSCTVALPVLGASSRSMAATDIAAPANTASTTTTDTPNRT